MKPENRKFLEDNRHHYDTLRNAFYIRHLNAGEREGMVRVMGEEFAPGYTADLWCSPCVADMVTLLYTRYDAWLAAQPKEQTEVVSTKPLIIASNFPSNKADKHELHTPDSIDRPKSGTRKR